MHYLLIVSLIWSLSFGMIGATFAGVNSDLLAGLRLAIAMPLFLPFLRYQGLSIRQISALLAIGAIQYGLMYSLLFRAFTYLQGHEVAILTVVTPLWVVLFHSLWERKLRWLYLVVAVLALLGGLWIEQPKAWSAPIQGIILMQLSNAAFAFGQIWYVQIRRKQLPDHPDHRLYALPFLGGAVCCLIATTFSGGWNDLPQLDSTQWAALFYLGVVASGLGFFGWNKGATLVNAGQLAVWNNLKIPLAVTVSVVVFGETTSITALILGGTLILVSLLVSGK